MLGGSSAFPGEGSRGSQVGTDRLGRPQRNGAGNVGALLDDARLGDACLKINNSRHAARLKTRFDKLTMIDMAHC